MNRYRHLRIVGLPMLSVTALLFALTQAARQQADAPPAQNLAPAAQVTASSCFSDAYQPRYVTDGQVPYPLSMDDLGRVWTVAAAHAAQAWIRFEWPQSVPVQQVAIYNRNAWSMDEHWRRVELCVNDDTQPAAVLTAQSGHGPQCLTLPEPQTVRSLTLRLSEPVSGNPGLSEVQIFDRALSTAQLPVFAGPHEMYRVTNPMVDVVDVQQLHEMIDRLQRLHGERYRQAAAHREALRALRRRAASGEDVAQALLTLQRDVMTWDIPALLVIERHEINPSHVYTYHCEDFKPGGGLHVIEPRPPYKRRTLVSSPEGQILDCDLSPDGKRVLFSWRRNADEGYRIFCIDIDGKNLKQLTHGDWHDYNACWLPDGGIAFLSTRVAQFAYCWFAPVGILHRMEADGSHVTQLSANYLNDFTPTVLDDGRIIYSRWEYVDRPAISIQGLWTINPDGTGLAGFFGNRVISPGTFMEARSVPGTDAVLCIMTGHNGPARGAVGLLDRTQGDNHQEAIVNLTPENPIPPVDQGYGNTDGMKQYSGPYPLDSERFLVSIRGPVIVRALMGGCETMILPPPGSQMQYLNAIPVRPRPTPFRIASMLPKKSPWGNYARVFLQDVYAGLEPTVKRGAVKRLRIVRELPKTVRITVDKQAFGFQFPVVSAGATYAPKEVLGETPVLPDGSASFLVPTGVPVYFMALDAHGRAVQRMRTFTHFMPGETQSCIGCHEPRNRAPAASATPMAFHRPIQRLELPEWGRGGFSYAHVVQPVWNRNCIGCHSGPNPPNKVDLTGDITDFFNMSYETLARGREGVPLMHEINNPYTSWIPTYNGCEQNILEIAPYRWGSPASTLGDLLMAGHPDARGKARVRLTDAERRRVFAWIDLNVPYYGTSETAHPEALGCRRLYPEALDRVLADVVSRRCVECHTSGNIPRPNWVRIERPEWNRFLTAPLSRDAGGSQTCGRAVFQSTADPDYQALLKAFEPVQKLAREKPRMDMPGGRPEQHVCRDRR